MSILSILGYNEKLSKMKIFFLDKQKEYEILKIKGVLIFALDEKAEIAIYNQKLNRLQIGSGATKGSIVCNVQPFEN